ncbi:hypothetical protein HK104_011262 [Borealophlyctis nickersoniae]|nr:hypothetical protein HK104_011262 [Borealophlyctis nickersoniae]
MSATLSTMANPAHLLSNSWTYLVDTYSQESLFVAGTFLIQLVVFWVPGLIYLFLDIYQPPFSQRHKIQPTLHIPLSQIRECILVVLRNQFLVSVPTQLLSYPMMVHTLHATKTLPSAAELARDLPVSFVVREILFYYSHRLLHHRSIYRYIHKSHHRFTAPIAISSEYAHPLEHVVSNILPIVAGPTLMRSHLVTLWIWISFTLMETLMVHSGYDFPGGIAKFHDFHHEKFTTCYGVTGFLDWVHGTDTGFRERHAKSGKGGKRGKAVMIAGSDIGRKEE